MDGDKSALLAIFTSTGGDNWKKKKEGGGITINPFRSQPPGWGSTIDKYKNLAAHVGVTVKGGRVAEIRLPANELTGTLPAEMGNLDALRSLEMFSNKLIGTLPLEIGRMKSLQRLDFRNNSLRGELPSELGSLQLLTQLNLSLNNFSGSLPSSLGELQLLEVLDLSNNTISGEIPSELGSCFKLKSLFLQNNRLIGAVPTELNNCRDLSNYNFGGRGNNVTGTVGRGSLRSLSHHALQSFSRRLGIGGAGSSFSSAGEGDSKIAPPEDRYAHRTMLTPRGHTGGSKAYEALDTAELCAVVLKRFPRDAGGRPAGWRALLPGDGSTAGTGVAAGPCGEFMREVAALQKLAHRPSVVEMIETFEEFDSDANQTFDVLVLKKGGANLHELMFMMRQHDGGNIETLTTKVQLLACCVADCVKNVHAYGIVHGDIKPSNLIGDGGGGVMLIDFDSCAAIPNGPLSGGAGAFQLPTTLSAALDHQAFTAEYLAPERARDEMQRRRHPASPSVDNWALGMVIYWLCTGIDFFHGKDEATILQELGRAYLEISVDAVGRGTNTHRLLTTLLCPNPAGRCSLVTIMSNNAAFFNPRSAGGAYGSNRGGGGGGGEGMRADITELLRKVDRVGFAVNEVHIVASDTLDAVSQLQLQTAAVHAKLDDAIARLGSMAQVLDAVALGELRLPKLFLVLPAATAAGTSGFAAGLKSLASQPGSLAKKLVHTLGMNKLRLIFLCEEGFHECSVEFEIMQPKEWLKKAAPAIQFSIVLIKVGLKVGGIPDDFLCALGLDGDLLSGISESMSSFVNEATAAKMVSMMESITEDITTSIEATSQGAAILKLGGGNGGGGSAPPPLPPRPSSGSVTAGGGATALPPPLPARPGAGASKSMIRQLIGGSYRQMELFLDTQYPDWQVKVGNSLRLGRDAGGGMHWTCGNCPAA